MNLAHLTSSRFFGGPERQMLELAVELQPCCRTSFVSFSEGGLCRDFLDQAATTGFEATELVNDTPHLFAATREISGLLRREQIDLLLCHGYKAGMLGLVAARWIGIPVIAVSRGWTSESRRVRLYEALDRRMLRHMDRVVCVSQAQAAKVARAGVSSDRIVVIRNAIRTERFASPRLGARRELESLFPTRPRLIVGAAGRLSPEKGFDVLVTAAAAVVADVPDAGFVIFGDGPLAPTIKRQIHSLGLPRSVVLGGFRRDLDDLLPQLDIFVLPSYSEGLPNVVLESMAAGVPVVATAVGGTPEVIADGASGYLVPAGNAQQLAARVKELIADESLRHQMSVHARERVEQVFSFAAQAAIYFELFDTLRSGSHPELASVVHSV